MEIFLEISAIIGIATGVALIMQLLRQPLVLGHIISGILVGPAVFHILKSEEAIEVFSHLGITSLLFIVGLSLSPKVIREVGSVSLVAGIGQVIFTSALGFLIGLAFQLSWIVSLYLAIAFTFSSTIIISKILSDKHETNKLHGKIAIGMLLVQDVLATLALILITSSMAGGSIADIATMTILKGVIVGGGIYLVSVYLLPSLTKMFAKSQEFLFLFSIGWGLGVAALFYLFGLSIELGALAAGVALASSPYHYEMASKMKLLRDFFIIMFFILLGSQLTAGNVAEFFWPVLAYSAFILIGNPLIVMTIMGAMGYTKKTSFKTGLTVAQISEFSLILLMLGIQAGHLGEEYLSLATIVGITTIAISTVMMLNSDKLYSFCEPLLSLFEKKMPQREIESRETFNTILFGCHRLGSDFLPSILKRRKSYLVVDFDPQVIENLKRQDIHARYGDSEDDEFLESLRLDKVKVVISTVPDFEANAHLLEKIRKNNPKAIVIVLAHHIYEAHALYKDGASYVIMPHHMGGNYAAMLVSKHGQDATKFALEKEKHLKHLKERHKYSHPFDPVFLRQLK